MKRWTFQDQTVASFILTCVASVAAAWLHLPLVGRLAFFAVGIGYILRGVAPAAWQIQWGNKAGWAVRILGLFFLLQGIFGRFF